MKSKILLGLLLFLGVAATAVAQCSLLDKYADEKGVEYVYISKAMLNLVTEGGFSSGHLKMPGSVQGKLDCIQVVSCDENKKVVGNMVADAKAFVKNCEKEKFEVMMKAKEDEEVTTIYGRTTKEVNEYLLISYDTNECNFVYVKGRISVEDIKKYIK